MSAEHGPVGWFLRGTWPSCRCGFDPHDNGALADHFADHGFKVHDDHGTLVRTPVCPHCHGPMEKGGFAIACAPDLTAVDIPLPAHCPSRECRKARDEAAIEAAIEAGVIDR